VPRVVQPDTILRWHRAGFVYLNNELRFTATSPFMDLNDQAFLNWDFGHINPTGAQKGGADSLHTAGDLAAAMSLNTTSAMPKRLPRQCNARP
jgi:hypothetical protein